MQRKNYILIAEILGTLVAVFLGVLLFMEAEMLMLDVDGMSDQVVALTSQGELDDVEGYGALVDLLGLTLGSVSAFALLALGLLVMMLAFPALLCAIIARVSFRPGKHGRYVVLTILALGPLVLFDIAALVLCTGSMLSVFWLGTFLLETAIIAYCIVATSRLLKADGEAGGDVGGPYGGDYVPAPEDAR